MKNGIFQVKEKLHICQSENGYRYSLDPFLLADFTSASKGDRIIDLGAGNGILSLLLSRKFKRSGILGLEIQDSLVEIARQNVLTNRLEHRIEIIKGDIKDVYLLFKEGSFDITVSNPPYRKIESGRISPNPERAIARHEIAITLLELLRGCGYLLRNLGRAFFIYHPSRLKELLQGMKRSGINPCCIRFIHSKAWGEAKMVLAEGIKNGKEELIIMDPLIISRSTHISQ
ncbi:MAG: tRNA1(Val) (adenine(37)-N6)-methyltransferase [Nitrospinota bacterium]